MGRPSPGSDDLPALRLHGCAKVGMGRSTERSGQIIRALSRNRSQRSARAVGFFKFEAEKNLDGTPVYTAAYFSLYWDSLSPVTRTVGDALAGMGKRRQGARIRCLPRHQEVSFPFREGQRSRWAAGRSTHSGPTTRPEGRLPMARRRPVIVEPAPTHTDRRGPRPGASVTYGPGPRNPVGRPMAVRVCPRL